VTLDAGGNNNAVFIIRSATSITTQATSKVVLAGNANPANIFWVAGSAVTLGTNSIMKGTIIASSSISLLTGANLVGRVLIQSAAAGQISLDQNTIVLP
jgi:glutamate synthase domain-containing protein 3